MPAILRFLHLTGLVVWIGGIVFFSFVAAPALFGALPRDMAGRATAAIFPRYYLVGFAAGALAFVSAALGGFLRPRSWTRLLMGELLLLLLMLVLTLYAWKGILPEAARLRVALRAPGGDQEISAPATADREALAARFQVLHRRSVALNGATLALGTLALLSVALRLKEVGP